MSFQNLKTMKHTKAEEKVNNLNKDIFSMENFLKIVFSYMKRKGKRLM